MTIKLLDSSIADKLPPTLDRKETAEVTKLTVRTLANLKYQGKGPKCSRPNGGKVVYRTADVLAWLAGGDN